MFAAGCGILFWLLESFLHVFIFHEGTLIQQIFAPEPHEIWMRLIAISIIIVFGIYVQFIINRRKQEEEKIKYINKELDLIFNTAADGMRLIDKNFNVVRVNKTLSDMSGRDKKSALGKKCYETFYGSLCHTANCPLSQILKGAKRIECDVDKERSDGTKVSCIVTAIPFYKPNGDESNSELLGIIEDFKDITERKRIEKELEKYRFHLEELIEDRAGQLKVANEQLKQEIIERKQVGENLRNSESKLAAMLASFNEHMSMMDKDLNIIWANKTAKNIFGDNIIGKKCYEVYHGKKEPCEPNPCLSLQAFIDGKTHEHETEVIDKEGKVFYFHCTANVALKDKDGKPTSVIEVSKDITERKKLEEELQKMQKLESLGVLAGGIAHDFNNLLTAIIGNLSLIELYAKSGGNIFEVLEETKKASNQTKRLTQQLLTFSTGGEPIKKNVSMAKLLKDTASLALSGSNVICEFSLPDDLWWAEVDEGQIDQAINNLVINAKQAMPGGGTIRIGAENGIVGAKQGLPLKEGKYVKVSIKDQGTGIMEEYLPKIFYPYFTTKQAGSGLGLAITYSIINKHGGHITVESEIGDGTTFNIFLPAFEKEIFRVKDIEEVQVYKGKGNILFMDDKENIKNMVKHMLNQLGYEVEFVGDGAEAIELYKEAKASGHKFDAVILDLTIPGGMGGIEAIQKLREIDPQIKAIVSSGYSNDPIMSEYKGCGFKGVIAKPYEIKELGEVLYRVINGKEVTVRI